jgi:hypothetical protein
MQGKKKHTPLPKTQTYNTHTAAAATTAATTSTANIVCTVVS